MKQTPHSFDILGNIAIVKFSRETNSKEKKQFAKEIMESNKSITTVLEKTRGFRGRLRKQQTKFVAGENTKEAKYKENNCVFRFNIDSTYFSSRLSNERKELAKKIKKGKKVLVMFAGVAPFSIVIAKNSQANKVYSNEINREANKYAKLNIELNKLKEKVILLPGDVKKIVEKINNLHSPSARGIKNDNKKDISLTRGSSINSKSSRATLERDEIPNKFDVIVMPRPQLKDTFLKQAFSLSKKGTRIYYYDFCKEDETDSVIERIKHEASISRKKIKILNKKAAGEIAPYKIRLRVDFRVM